MRAWSCPIDAHPAPQLKSTGAPWRTRVQVFDAPFSLQNAASFTLHDTVTGEPHHIKGQPYNRFFDDTQSYWDPIIPTSSVKVPTHRHDDARGASRTARR